MRASDQLKPNQGLTHDLACVYLKEHALWVAQRAHPTREPYGLVEAKLEFPVADGGRHVFIDLVIQAATERTLENLDSKNDREKQMCQERGFDFEPCGLSSYEIDSFIVEVKVRREAIGVVLRQLKTYRRLTPQASYHVLAHSYPLCASETAAYEGEGFRLVPFKIKRPEA